LAASEQGRGYLERWLHNAERRDIPRRIVVEIARRGALNSESFRALQDFEEVEDPDGKSFFLIPRGTPGDDARRAALLTYVLNAGTDYGAPGRYADFPAVPYCADEVARIADRQSANRWTYARVVGLVHRNGGRLVTTPNGILMGVGGNWIQRQFSRRGGTTWGDMFMLNMSFKMGFKMGDIADPAERLRRIVRSGHAWYVNDGGEPFESNLDLDRLLHHEERHSRQWAQRGRTGMLRDYGWELFRELVFGMANRLEEEAGLSDGGYR
jgi:hypothetical protein